MRISYNLGCLCALSLRIASSIWGSALSAVVRLSMEIPRSSAVGGSTMPLLICSSMALRRVAGIPRADSPMFSRPNSIRSRAFVCAAAVSFSCSVCWRDCRMMRLDTLKTFSPRCMLASSSAARRSCSASWAKFSSPNKDGCVWAWAISASMLLTRWANPSILSNSPRSPAFTSAFLAVSSFLLSVATGSSPPSTGFANVTLSAFACSSICLSMPLRRLPSRAS